MRHARLWAFVGMLAAMLVAACGEEPIREGVVIDKRYEPPRSTIHPHPILFSHPHTSMSCSVGANGVSNCTTRTWLHMHVVGYSDHVHEDDEDWVLVLRAGDRTGEVEVSEGDWDGIEVGEQWTK